MKVALLDDDKVVLETVSSLLGGAGFHCSTFDNGRQLVRALHRDTFDLFVIDWNLPDLPGLNVLEWIRNQIGAQPPVLLLTNRVSDEDMVAGLRAGADDFVTKPYQPAVLLARVEALARRSTMNLSRTTETYGKLDFELTSKTLRNGGEVVHLTPKEFNLALLLFRNLNRAVSRAYIFETIWGMDPDLSTRTLDIHISKIRSKLALRPESGYRLTPVYGYGYRLEEYLA
ncbi:response regulator transcription factor [Novosphingobium flavum]|uniref:Response regulator transcription factor n=1 Tax=Novosphingobium aerophilum TaxID=2839843 RepID=A0A7X1F7D6_9SPHN|nr:response regulator transcription factor [Novosphingobium aerophilum]MBC2651733.1 response regulator transcription factor [Novosphingobium aerophilum]MBC2662079.1 response regulator transcription factor [Novosphingobium aerophilum]